MFRNINFYPDIAGYRRYKSTILFNLAESDYLGFRHLCLLEQPAIGLILFSGQQSIEKYLKAIILLNGEPINKLGGNGHNLSNIYYEAVKISKNLNSKKNSDYCTAIISLFNNAEHARYASTHIIVDDMLHHKLDSLVIETLRKSYLEDYNEIFNQDIDYKYLELILESKDAFPNSHNSLTYDNNCLGFELEGVISTIRQVNYKLKTTAIVNNQNLDDAKSLQNEIGIKLSKDEFDKTFTITGEELMKEPEVKKDIESYLLNRRNK